MDHDLLRSLFRTLLYLRLTEEKIVELYPQQEIRCPVHLSIGQEGVAVGVCQALSSQDMVFSGHRSHSHYLAKGGNLQKFFAEMYGKVTGCCRGMGGSMHLVDLSVNFMGATPIVASAIPVAVGAAFAASLKGLPYRVVMFIGDAAVEEGVFHESLNFAILKKLPVLFICENNFYSVYTPLHERQPPRPILQVAQGHGAKCYSIDGNDVTAVYEATTKALEYIRQEGGPVFIEATTYRWREHCGPNYDNHIGYRSEEEFAQWKEKDPLAMVTEKVLGENIMGEQEIKALKKEIGQEIEEAVKVAKAASFPEKKQLTEWIYAP